MKETFMKVGYNWSYNWYWRCQFHFLYTIAAIRNFINPFLLADDLRTALHRRELKLNTLVASHKTVKLTASHGKVWSRNAVASRMEQLGIVLLVMVGKACHFHSSDGGECVEAKYQENYAGYIPEHLPSQKEVSLSADGNGPKVDRISPVSGSVRGATEIAIEGSGFSPTTFNFGPGNEHLGNKVFLELMTSSVQCDVKHASDTRIVCGTRRASPGSYTIRLAVDGIFIEDIDGQYCDNMNDCTFTYSLDMSPKTLSVTPSNIVPGTILDVRGQIFTDKYFQNDAEKDEDLPSILRVYNTGQECSLLYTDEEGEQQLYGITLDSDSTWGNFQCRPGGTFIGSQNVSMIVSGYGRTLALPQLLKVSAQNKLYMFQTHAEIISVDPSAGSTEGGTHLTIIGKHFDTDSTVLVGGVPCIIDDITTTTTITCVTGAQPAAQSPYPGNRGLLREVWTGTTVNIISEIATLDESSPGYLDEIVVDGSSESGSDAGDNYVSRLSGYFVAPYDSDFTFFIIADNEAQLYFSETENRSDKQLIASCSSPTSNWFSFDEQKSELISLTGGTKYYIEALHREYSGEDSVKIGVLIDDTPFVHSQVESAVNEFQKIQISSVTKQEIQSVTLFTEDVFQFVYDGIESDPLSISSEVAEIQGALLKMFSVQCLETQTAPTWFLDDFENDVGLHETGERVQDEEPFCGQTSLKNPTNIYVAPGEDGFPVSVYNTFCFAYRGAINPQFKLNVAWTDIYSQRKERHVWYDFDDDFVVSSDAEWFHTCVDLEDILLADSRLPSEFTFYILSITLKGELEEDFYIDNVFIGAGHVSYVITSPAARPNGLFISNVTVEKYNNTFDVAMLPENCGFDFPLIGMKNASIISGSRDADSDYVEYCTSAACGDGADIVINREQSATPPVGGTFQIELGGKIAVVPADATESDMQEIFDNSFDIGVSVVRTDTCAGYTWTIEFSKAGGNHPPMSVDNSGLTGLDVDTVTETLSNGGLYLFPIPGDYLRTLDETPQVTVSVNQIPSTCTGDCSFEYLADLTPQVTGISPISGSASSSTEVTLLGVGFSQTADDNKVTIGGVNCAVTNALDTTIICLIGEAPGGTQDVVVYVAPDGLATHPSGTVQFQYEVGITDVNPSSGSTGGGLEITITGYGYSNNVDDLTVLIGGALCDVTSSSQNTIICILPAGVAGSVDLSVSISDVSATSVNGFQYDASTTPSITQLSITQSSVAGGATLVVSGTGFGTDESSSDALKIGDVPCQLISYSDNTIECILPAQSPGVYDVRLYVDNVGYADSSFETTITYQLSVTAINPGYGSIKGGTLVTISGEGFSNVNSENVVIFGNIECLVISSNSNEIQCMAGDSGTTHNVDNSGLHADYGLGYKWSPQSITIEAGDTVLWEWGLPGLIKGITYGVQQTRDANSVEYDGSGFKTQSRSATGSFSHTFTVPGTYYYSSGPVDSFGEFFMKGVVIVTDPVAVTEPLSVTVGGFEALYETNSGVSVTSSSSCLAADPSCATSQPVGVDSNIFYFVYTGCYTPIIDSVNPTSGTSGTQITITGEGFATTQCANQVTIVGHPCNVQSCTETIIVCDIDTEDALTVGVKHPITVQVENHGFALNRGSATFELIPHIDSVTPDSGSLAGGARVTIQGSGFSSDAAVVVGLPCEVESVAYNEIVCITSPNIRGVFDVSIMIGSTTSECLGLCLFEFSNAMTPIVSTISPTDIFGASTSLTITGTGFGNGVVTVTVGEHDCSVQSITDIEISCDIGYVPVGEHQVEVNRADQGSFGGSCTLVVTGDGFDDEYTVVTIDGNNCPISSVTATDLQCEIPANNNLALGTYTCDIQVSISTSTAVAIESNALTYDSSITPIITSVSPRRGGTGGGTPITITGSGFRDSENTVTIDGSLCVISSESTSEIICETEPNSRSIETKVRVLVNGDGIATQDDADFEYVDLWTSPWTWGGNPLPIEGDFVVIQQGQRIVLDIDTPVLKMLVIQGGALIFDEADLELKAENILITDGGLLQVGTEEEPFQHKAIITMYGNVRSPQMPLYGAKTLAVRNGTLDLHGIPIPVTWTYLAETAPAGATQITLMQEVTWQVGDEIVIATTSHRHSMIENEQLTITAVSNDGLTIEFQPALEYEHISMEETIDGVVLTTRAEVGLLTRNVLVRGSAHAEWNTVIETCPEEFDTDQFATQTCFQGRFGEETGSDQFGSQIMFAAKEQDLNLVTGRIEYIEVTHAGQAFRLARYPIHFHMNGDVSGSYVRGCGIHHTFNRAVTIHGVHNLLVEHNVAFDIMGHAYFMEDGIETNNIIQYNLGIFVKASASLLSVDITPAVFWITNPDNIVRHNAAAGSTHFGFWYNMPVHPGGPSFTSTICPRNIPVAEFQNNTAHSLGWYGLWVFPIYTPMEGGTCSSNIPTASHFYDLTSWNNERGAEVVESGPVQLHEFVVFNNDKAGIEMVDLSGGYVDGPMVKDSVVIGHSSIINASASCTIAGIKTPKSAFLTVDGVKFINFDEDRCAALRACAHCKNRQGGWKTKFQNLEFFNSPNKVGFQWEHEAVYVDLDGSLTGSANYIVTPNNGLLPSDHCDATDLAFNVGTSPGVVCDNTVKLHRFSFNHAASSLQYKDVIFTLDNSLGSSIVPYEQMRLTHSEGWMITLVDGKNYNMVWEDAEQLTNISYVGTLYNMEPTDYVTISHSVAQTPDRFSILGHMADTTEEMVTYDDNDNGDFYFDNATHSVSYLLSGKGESEEVNRDVTFNVYRCLYPDCITPVPLPPPAARPANAILWSDVASWAGVEDGWGGSNGVLPADGDDVMILQDTWIVADVKLPYMNKLFIYGTLEIDDTMNNMINATYVFIRGGRLVVGWEDAPFKHNFRFLLQGNHWTPEMLLPNGPNLGSKVIGVFGDLDLHGKEPNIYWTHLAATANVGDDIITMEDAVNWKVGDEIVIAPTDYEPFHTEIFTVLNVIDNYTLQLDNSLQYTHLGVSHTLADGSWSYTLAAEVGLLSHNIVIEGADNPAGTLSDESFGCRVFIGRFIQEGVNYVGNGRIENVEFKNCGQEGWPDYSDPRYALAFRDVGDIIQNSSYIRGNSFHHGFNTGIGVYTTNGLNIENNVIHHTVGAGIIVAGSENRLEHNLVTLTIFPGTYQDRFEPVNLIWMGGIEVNKAMRVVMKNNAVGGSERIGFKISGEPCYSEPDPENKWEGNVAHTTLHGIHMYYSDGLTGCSKISNFLVYRSYDFGVWFHPQCSVMMSNLVLVDNYASVMPMVYAPHALSHQTSDKFSNSDAIQQSSKQRAPRTPSGGKSGVTWASFTSSTSGAPFFPFHGLMDYPAISGKTMITDVTFSNFGSACGTTDVAIITNPANGDAMHPIFMTGAKFVDVLPTSKVFIHWPSLDFVNPADCVDMDCDGKKKAIIKDLDGGLLGTPGTVIPKSEYEWDGDRRHGVGDYRIPLPLLTNLDGSRKNIDDVAPNKGIIRNDECVFHDDWHAYECHDLNYIMMVIESMDEDTETRRVSPIGLVADGYMDLINGPMDQGWCLGYTCQERISTFYTIVSSGKIYDMAFTGTNPQNLRFHLLNADDDETVRIDLWGANPQRLDVYRNNVYIAPTNAQLSGSSFTWLPRNPSLPDDQYLPTIGGSSGQNFHDNKVQTLYFLIRGSDVIEVRLSPVIIVAFGIDPVHIDDFFEINLISNLANLFGISADQIRVVDIVRQSKRRRRAVDPATVTVEIGDPPTPTIDSLAVNGTDNSTFYANSNYTGLNDSLSFEELEEIASYLVNEGQSGGLDDVLGVKVLTLSVTDPVAPAVDSTGGVRATNETGGPADGDGDHVNNLGHSSSPWQLSVSLRPNTSDTRAQLLGNTSVVFVNGCANFTNLAVTHAGDYILDFVITVPENTTLGVVSTSFTVSNRPYSLGVVAVPDSAHEGELFTPQPIIEIVDTILGETAEDISWKGHKWTSHIKLFMPSLYLGNLQGNLTVPVQADTSQTAYSDLYIDTYGKNYILEVTVSSSPADYELSVVLSSFDVIDPDASILSGTTKSVTLTFDEDYNSTLSESYLLVIILSSVFGFIAVCVIGVCICLVNKKQHSGSKSLVHAESMPLTDKTPISERFLGENSSESGIALSTPETPAVNINGQNTMYEFTQDDFDNINLSSRPVSALSARSGSNTPLRSPTIIVESLPPGSATPSGNQESELDVDESMTVIALSGVHSFSRLGNVVVNLSGSMDRLRKELVKALPSQLKGKPFVFLQETLNVLETVKERKVVVSEIYGGDCIMLKMLPDSAAERFFCHCGAVSHIDCTLCGKQSYCSAKCQSADWPKHMLACLKADNKLLLP
ncbi:fibrocystin-L-like [Saccoglossus kowalevskii]|uniref:Fibrocystin-L-like n=1 Tax=Saccoglossus kowalevskii TaxID=10224 RepID=A0ABM0N117_SACKO|nr:PREDICTED: fibrocystin-L-like [Saccoglossus kowalevskii]